MACFLKRMKSMSFMKLKAVSHGGMSVCTRHYNRLLNFKNTSELGNFPHTRRSTGNQTLVNLIKRHCSTSESSQWPLQRMKINACHELYAFRNMTLGDKDKPLRGIDFDVTYLDTWPTAPNRTPVILALHGVAYSHCFILPMLKYLLENKVRVIAPNFPGCGLTPMDPKGIFTHTPEEKAAFVVDFLLALHLTKVDVLVSHSAAVYPSAVLLSQTNIFKSLVLLMPGSLEPLARDWKSMQMYLILSTLLKKLRLNSLLQVLTDKVKKFRPTLKMSQEQIDSTVQSLLNVDHKRIYDNLVRIKFSQVPLMVCYAKNDKIIGPHIESVLKPLGLTADQFTSFDENMNASGAVLRPQSTAYGIVFENGGHEIETVHAQIIGKAISDLFNYVKSPA